MKHSYRVSNVYSICSFICETKGFETTFIESNTYEDLYFTARRYLQLFIYFALFITKHTEALNPKNIHVLMSK